MAKEAEQIYKSTCRMCHGVCGVLVHVRNGKVVKIIGDKDRPASKGYICPKGPASIEYIYHPQRLRHPLKRLGEKGGNRWQRISWNQALTEIADALLDVLATDGPETIIQGGGTRVHSQGSEGTGVNAFFEALGCPLPSVNGVELYVARGRKEMRLI